MSSIQPGQAPVCGEKGIWGLISYGMLFGGGKCRAEKEKVILRGGKVLCVEVG